jgi:DNA-binding transcriptional LysR family regulator
MLDFARLRSFVAVARHESVSRAARELHISQSPLSRQIASLEASLGLALFNRRRKRLHLTDAGRAFLADAEALLDAAAAVERRAQALASGVAGHLTIGYVPAAVHSGVLPRELARLRRRAPSARLELRALRSSEQLAALDSGAIDVGYAHSPAPAECAVESTLLVEEPFVLAVPRAARGRSPRRLLTEQPLVTVPESVSPRAFGELVGACVAIGARPSVRIEAADPAIVLALVGAGLGVAIVQRSLAVAAPRTVRFVRLPPRFPIRMAVYRLMRPTGGPLSDVLRGGRRG